MVTLVFKQSHNVRLYDVVSVIMVVMS